MDNDKINEIEDILKDEEFRVGNFEFKLERIRKSWSTHLIFDFKVYNPKDESFCTRCLEGLLYSELKPYLRYLGIDEQNVNIGIYDKNERLEKFYFTNDFIDGLLDEIKKITDVNFEDGDIIVILKQKPIKITLEEIHDYNNVLNITIYAKYIDHYFESDFDLEIYENVPLTKTNYWEDFKDKLDLNESWYFDVVGNYFDKLKSTECLAFKIQTYFI